MQHPEGVSRTRVPRAADPWFGVSSASLTASSLPAPPPSPQSHTRFAQAYLCQDRQCPSETLTLREHLPRLGAKQPRGGKVKNKHRPPSPGETTPMPFHRQTGQGPALGLGSSPGPGHPAGRQVCLNTTSPAHRRSPPGYCLPRFPPMRNQ